MQLIATPLLLHYSSHMALCGVVSCSSKANRIDICKDIVIIDDWNLDLSKPDGIVGNDHVTYFLYLMMAKYCCSATSIRSLCSPIDVELVNKPCDVWYIAYNCIVLICLECNALTLVKYVYFYLFSLLNVCTFNDTVDLLILDYSPTSVH